ncbi:MAG: class I SAM-dependent methyltransferase [Pseudomonadota bacterium]|nr:class I SAM-dependent methyltransferase [Pseudomonadota bacterium]
MSSATRTGRAHAHTPPLGHRALTPLYDLAIAAMTRETTWRAALVKVMAPSPGDRILDIGSGTGSLSVALSTACPRIRYVGVDPDADAVRRARQKIVGLEGNIRFHGGYFSAEEEYFSEPPNKIVSSLVLHQVSLAEKRRIIVQARKALAAGGSLFIADYGLQRGIQRLLFRSTVQTLDGVGDTQPNAEGIIPKLLESSRFSSVNETERLDTATGTISIYVARLTRCRQSDGSA